VALQTRWTFPVARRLSFDRRLATALAHAYDVIEIRVPNKKNFRFGVMGL